MSKDRLVKSVTKFADVQYKLFTKRYGQQLIDIFEFPIKLVLSPFTIAFDVAGSAQRGFGVPELISKLSCASIFVSSCKVLSFFMWGFCFVSQVWEFTVVFHFWVEMGLWVCEFGMKEWIFGIEFWNFCCFFVIGYWIGVYVCLWDSWNVFVSQSSGFQSVTAFGMLSIIELWSLFRFS